MARKIEKNLCGIVLSAALAISPVGCQTERVSEIKPNPAAYWYSGKPRDYTGYGGKIYRTRDLFYVKNGNEWAQASLWEYKEQGSESWKVQSLNRASSKDGNKLVDNCLRSRLPNLARALKNKEKITVSQPEGSKIVHFQFDSGRENYMTE
jgi:hypothetical protein